VSKWNTPQSPTGNEDEASDDHSLGAPLLPCLKGPHFRSRILVGNYRANGEADKHDQQSTQTNDLWQELFHHLGPTKSAIRNPKSAIPK
jgi:hypothetical protein